MSKMTKLSSTNVDEVVDPKVIRHDDVRRMRWLLAQADMPICMDPAELEREVEGHKPAFVQ